VHRNNLMNKLQLRSVRDLVLYAVRQGMVDSWTVDSDRGSGLP
jgi:hypothetical protein